MPQREAPRSPSPANPGWMRADLCLWECRGQEVPGDPRRDQSWPGLEAPESGQAHPAAPPGPCPPSLCPTPLPCTLLRNEVI